MTIIPPPLPYLHHRLDVFVQVDLTVEELLGLIRVLHALLHVVLVLAQEGQHQTLEPLGIQKLDLKTGGAPRSGGRRRRAPGHG